MNFIPTAIQGVVIAEPVIFRDPRGYFCETYNEGEFGRSGINARFVQDNESCSCYGVIRGLHCQTGSYSQAKLIRVLRGEILDVAVDIRQGSPTYGQHVAVELSGDNRRQLFIPRHFLHGFAVLSIEAVITYKVDRFYCPGAEMTVSWDDPDLGIDWRLPADRILLSDKDRSRAVRLRDVIPEAAD